MVSYSFHSIKIFRLKNFLCIDRPVIVYNALKPQKWAEHARWHRFRFPCCFCPSKGWVGDDVYTESKVALALSGTCTGKWIATCSDDRCTYFGELFLLFNTSLMPDDHLYYSVFGRFRWQAQCCSQIVSASKFVRLFFASYKRYPTNALNLRPVI